MIRFARNTSLRNFFMYSYLVDNIKKLILRREINAFHGICCMCNLVGGHSKCLAISNYFCIFPMIILALARENHTAYNTEIVLDHWRHTDISNLKHKQ